MVNNGTRRSHLGVSCPRTREAKHPRPWEIPLPVVGWTTERSALARGWLGGESSHMLPIAVVQVQAKPSFLHCCTDGPSKMTKSQDKSRICVVGVCQKRDRDGPFYVQNADMCPFSASFRFLGNNLLKFLVWVCPFLVICSDLSEYCHLCGTKRGPFQKKNFNCKLRTKLPTYFY